MSLTDFMAEQRRLVILATLAEAPDFALNDGSLRLALKAVAFGVTGDVLRGELFWLSEQGLARIEKTALPGQEEMWIAHLTAKGQEVAEGAPYPGIARPRAH